MSRPSEPFGGGLSLPFAIMALAWMFVLGLAPWEHQTDTRLHEVMSRLLSESSLHWEHMVSGFWLGLFWTLHVACRPGRRRMPGILGVMAGLTFMAVVLSIFQLQGHPSRVIPGGWMGHGIGIVAGALFASAARSGHAAFFRRMSANPDALWRVAVLASLMGGTLTMPMPEVIADLPRLLADHVYAYSKSVILWAPLGILLGLTGHGGGARAWMLAGMITLFLIGHGTLLHFTTRDWLELAAMVPGLALGLWLASGPFSAIEQKLPFPSAGGFSATPGKSGTTRAAIQPEGTRPLASGEAHDPALTGKTYPATRAERSGRFFGLLCLAGTAAALASYPVFQVALAVGILAACATVWYRPQYAMAVLAAALPIVDLAPWSGRFFLDELDLLLVAVLAVWLLRARAGPSLSWPSLARPVIALLAVGLVASTAMGLLPLQAIDPNAFSSYWSVYNGLRVAKGLLWGVVLLFLARQIGGNAALLTRVLGIGMATGLMAVCAVGLWERHLYAGLADTTSTYRIVGLFSSMHTGGGHIEAYMVAALPFLWLGLMRRPLLPVAVLLMGLATYVLLFTVSRGGALAFALVFLILALATARQAWIANQRRGAVLPLLAIVGVAGLLGAGVGGDYFQQRIAQSNQDSQTRFEHWRGAVAMMDEDWGTRLFGMGLGSFPRVFLERGAPEDRPGTYAFVAGRTGLALRLGAGATLYYAQRVSLEPGTDYRLRFDARAVGTGARLDTPMCEKQMLNSRRCVWSSLEIPGDGQWHTFDRVLHNDVLGQGTVLAHLPTEFVLSHGGGQGLLELDNVRLQDAQGRNLLCNGDFEQAGDCWFFKTHSHLPWHIKNVWVHVLFEQGWLGLVSFLALVLLALTRLARSAWSGQPLAWVLLASLAGMLTVGFFDSLLDAPRLALLLLGFLLIGAAPPWLCRARPDRRRRHGRARGPGPGAPRPPVDPETASLSPGPAGRAGMSP